MWFKIYPQVPVENMCDTFPTVNSLISKCVRLVWCLFSENYTSRPAVVENGTCCPAFEHNMHNGGEIPIHDLRYQLDVVDADRGIRPYNTQQGCKYENRDAARG